MATFTVGCRCGEQFHVDESAIGRRIACRRCGSLVEVVKAPARAADSTPGSEKSKRRKAHTKAPSNAHRIIFPRSRGSRALELVAWAYLAGVVLVAAVMWGLGDRSVVGTVLLFMGRWVVLLPLVLLLPAALWLRRSSLLPLALASLIAVGPVMGFRTGWRRLLPDPAGAQLRVVTYNAGGGNLLAQSLPTFLSRWQPQVVAFQECGDPLAAAVRLSAGWQQYVGRDLCLLSRYPILEARVMDRSGLDRIKQSETKELGGAGYVVRFTLQGPRGPLRVANLHLETPRKGLEGLADGELRRLRMNTEIRDVESHLAREWVDQGAGSLIVLGDFNTPVESRIFREHWGNLTNAFSTAGTGFGMTKHNGWIRVRIDHVLTSGEWHVDRVQVGSDTYSDHRPLVADLTLKN